MNKKFFIFFFITWAQLIVIGQNYFSKRIDISGKVNQSGTLLFINDTFSTTGLVYEIAFSQISTSLLKIDKFGNLFTAKRFKPVNRSYTGGGAACVLNKKIYTAGVTDWGLQLQSGLYVFNQNADTVFTRSYGDTVFYNTSPQILPYLRTKNKLLLISPTDSTCGVNHPGLYKQVLRIVDTNGVLYQTIMNPNFCSYISLWASDTTIKKGYVFCGGEYFNPVTYNYVIKLDSNLNTLWHKSIDTSTSLYSSIISLRSGQLLYAHNHSDFNTSSTYLGDRITLTKLDIAGNIIWRKRYGNSEQNIGVSKIKECSNGDYLLCGEKYIYYSSSVSQYVGWIMRTDSLGNLRWWKTYIPNDPIRDTIAQNELHDIIELPNKDIACVGWGGASGFNSLQQQTWLLKVDSNGCFGTSNCPQNIASGLQEEKIADADFKIYPNPANELLNVEMGSFVVTTTSQSQLILTNAIGQEIEKKIISNAQEQIDIKNLANGIYFVSLKNKEFSGTKKIVVQH